jgi:molecular chaperone DnaK
VSAKDKATGKEQKVEIQPTTGLSEAEIQKMIRDAEQHAGEDARRREEVELRNRGDNLAYAAESVLKESGDQLPSELKLELDSQAQAIRRALEQHDIAALRTASEALERAIERARTERTQPAEPVGAATPASGRSGGDNNKGGDDGGTVEGEFREV